MTQVAPFSTDVANKDFASVLADQTLGVNVVRGLRKPPVADKSPAGNHDLLADDIATISYEQALRTHARNMSAWNQQPAGLFENGYAAADQVATSAQPGFSPARILEIALKNARNERRSASITIRLSRTECDQIHTRADQAGITVSAYLRSCVLEAEDLRAQVKKMIAELKTAQSVSSEQQGVRKPQHAQLHWRRFWARFFRLRRVAQA